ncbi:uncharacterized protein LOC110007112 [Amborella trichopoda]|uniref:uncharacterized protein LOC110007112 n=1 Tax=Amborella trichopoda TaxID=13333 RepID=UPI0009C199CE|nr:uncharacterized protein LOC110007112 [Amborella trichopoda]|eukprot:XP_020521897.1 uncharacterized protein LOC110007112 [Amborella trichopoda]
MNLEGSDGLMLLVAWFKCCPLLEEINIWHRYEMNFNATIPHSLTTRGPINCWDHHLKTVVIYESPFQGNLEELVRYLVSNAKVIKTITCHINYERYLNARYLSLVGDLLYLPTASPGAQVLFK